MLRETEAAFNLVFGRIEPDARRVVP
jgi:hypothetical protein